MIVNDLKRKRERDYTFDWNAAFDVSDLYIVVKKLLFYMRFYMRID